VGGDHACQLATGRPVSYRFKGLLLGDSRAHLQARECRDELVEISQNR
jgi:hypothetical protein